MRHDDETHTMNMQAIAHHGVAPGRAVIPPFADSALVDEELSFRRLRTPAEFAQVRHLRSEIALPQAVLGDPAFSAREKKETSSGL